MEAGEERDEPTESRANGGATNRWIIWIVLATVVILLVLRIAIS